MTNLPVLASDTIPHETKLCNCVEFMPITVEPREWAGKAVEMLRHTERKNNLKTIQDAGYDIRKQYMMMQEFYLSKVEEL